MSNRVSVLALVVRNEVNVSKYRDVFEALLKQYGPKNSDHLITIKIFSSVSEFLKAQKENKNLHGTLVDSAIFNDATDVEKKAFELLENLKIPTMKFSQKLIDGDAAERKILNGKWLQLMEQVNIFAPRGLRVFPRKLCFVKVKYNRPGQREGESDLKIPLEVKAVTHDLSAGGCFIVSMDNWDSINEVEILVGDFPTPVTCHIAWKLPWGASPWKMPGIGVEFKNISEDLKNYLAIFLQESEA